MSGLGFADNALQCSASIGDGIGDVIRIGLSGVDSADKVERVDDNKMNSHNKILQKEKGPMAPECNGKSLRYRPPFELGAIL